MKILGGVLITIAVGVFVFLGVACKRKKLSFTDFVLVFADAGGLIFALVMIGIMLIKKG